MNDVDVFRIDAQAGQVVMLNAGAVVPEGSAEHAPTLTLTNSGGAAIPVSTVVKGYGSNSVLQFTAATSGAYYMHAAPQAQGAYTLTATRAGADDFGGTLDTSAGVVMTLHASGRTGRARRRWPRPPISLTSPRPAANTSCSSRRASTRPAATLFA